MISRRHGLPACFVSWPSLSEVLMEHLVEERVAIGHELAREVGSVERDVGGACGTMAVRQAAAVGRGVRKKYRDGVEGVREIEAVVVEPGVRGARSEFSPTSNERMAHLIESVSRLRGAFEFEVKIWFHCCHSQAGPLCLPVARQVWVVFKGREMH